VAPAADDEPPSGLYVDLIRLLCESEGIIPVFEQVRFSSAILEIQRDSVDVVLSIFQTPRRARFVDFTAFLHSVSVSGVTRRQEERVSSQSDLVALPLKFVVCREEIGHEILEDQLKIPSKQLTIMDTSNISDIIEMVAAKKADVAIADSVSCQHGLAGRGAEGPRLKPILRRRPLYLCPNGIMLAQGQDALSNWLDRGMKRLRDTPEFRRTEDIVLDEFNGMINRV
jgi:ABC-type amino acid transport substrate-binding protein